MNRRRKQSAAAFWMKVIGIIAYIALITYFAYQTWELVNWLFPAENLAMQIMAVFSFDICAAGWACAEMFYRFQVRTNRAIVSGMWVVSFILATLASVVMMFISAATNGKLNVTVPQGIVICAYGLIIIAVVSQLWALTQVIRSEWMYSHPYEDEEEDEVDYTPTTVKTSPRRMSVQLPPATDDLEGDVLDQEVDAIFRKAQEN